VFPGQPGLSRYVHIPLATLKDWEQGRKQPEAAAWGYLQVVEGEPAAVRRALKAA
jgi:putative transcriptional regulator